MPPPITTAQTDIPSRHPMLDRNGRVTPEWHKYFTALTGSSASSGTDTTVIKTVLVGGGNVVTEVPVGDTSLLANLPPVPNTILQTDGNNVISWAPLSWDKLPSGAGVWNAAPTIAVSLTVTGPASVNALITTRITTPSVPDASNLVISPTGDLVLAPAGLDVLPPSNYTINVGTPLLKFRTLSVGELTTDSLVPLGVRTMVSGRVLVAPSTVLVEDLLGGVGTLYVRDNTLATDDIVVLEARGQVEWIRITGALTFAQATPPKYGYPVLRNLSGDPTLLNWVKGDGAVNTRQANAGFLSLYVASGLGSTVGPTMVGNLRTGLAWNAIAPRWAIGNLHGLYGYTTDVFGSSFGDASKAWFSVDDTNGVRISYGSTPVLTVTPSGASSLTVTGDVTAHYFRGSGLYLTDLPGGGAGGMNLDYLGNFTTGPTYNDGDIVIAADGLAYMCVVDGTTVAPVAWPGVGIATSVGPPGPAGPTGPQGPAGVDAAVDASYWTVSPHATLTNERALSSLANGYVKSTAGVPSTVVTIPLAEGGTGATNASTARTNLGLGSLATSNYSGDPNTFLRGDGAWAAPPTSVGVPSGLIAIFVTACPAGWTRVAGWDGYFLRGNSTAGATGGATQHQHGAGSLTGASHSHGAGTLSGPSHNHGGNVHVPITVFGTTDTQGDHSHSIGGSLGTSDANSFATISGSGNFAYNTHRHDVSGLSTNSTGGHTHNLGVNTSGDGPIGYDGSGAVGGNTAAASAGVTGLTDFQGNYPPFVDVVYCQKN